MNQILREKRVRPAEYLENLGLLNARLIAAHACWLTKRECSLLGRRGVNVSHNPVSNLKLAGGAIAPLLELMGAGANITIGTDGACSNNSLNILESAKCAALLQKFHRWRASALNAQQALDFITLNGAKALGLDAGSIEPGKLADLAILELNSNLRPVHNIVSNIIYAANPSNVRDLIVNGTLVMRDRKIKTFDEVKVLERAHKIALDLATR